jgi:hypothetical protein
MQPDHRRALGFPNRIGDLQEASLFRESHSHGRSHHDGGTKLEETAPRNTAGFQMLLDGGLWTSSLVGHAAFLSLGSLRLGWRVHAAHEPECWLAAAFYGRVVTCVTPI